MINWFNHVVAATIFYFITKLSFSNILFRKLSNTVTLGRHQIWIQKTCLAHSINININIVQASQGACRKLKYFFPIHQINLQTQYSEEMKMNIVQSHQGMSRCIWRWICLPALFPSRSLPHGSCSSALFRRAGCVRTNLSCFCHCLFERGATFHSLSNPDRIFYPKRFGYDFFSKITEG